MVAFAGMNAASSAGGINANDLFAMGNQNHNNTPANNVNQNTWNCSCGKIGNTGNFCTDCGKPKPATSSWTCTCGNQNTGKFCTNCGKQRPEAMQAKCNRCGWEAKDSNIPKFCPECGNTLNG
jgi:hypothetical protein